ncbi:hypothetical protein ACT3SZ_01615 [Corynebacterium sp. AOP40-9SA-29]|uniref:hypothetical protein n=1 Tax=Corynebacterium sp. AOP40-9SA-29 TaxID=3457677 RepID=UPI0040342EAE
MDLLAAYSRTPRKARVISLLLALAFYSLVLVLFIALWVDHESSGLTTAELTLLTLTSLLLTPFLAFAALPHTVPMFLFRYETPEPRRIVVTTRTGALLASSMVPGTGFFLMYGTRIMSDVSYYGSYYVVVGIIGAMVSVWSLVKLPQSDRKCAAVVDISPHSASIASAGTKIEFDPSSCDIHLKKSLLRPSLVFSGPAKLERKDGTIKHRNQRMVVNNLNAGKINIDYLYELLQRG